MDSDTERSQDQTILVGKENNKQLNFSDMALIYVKGTISHMGEIQQGTSQGGYDWARQVIVLEIPSYNGTFSKIALTAQNQKVDEVMNGGFGIGSKVEVGYSVTAREYQGKWFNNVDLITIKSAEQVADPAPQVAPPAPAPQAAPQRRVARPATTPIIPPGESLEPQDDDMPF